MDKLKKMLEQFHDWFNNKALVWLKAHNIYDKKIYKKNGKLKRWLAIFFTSFVSFFLIVAIVATVVLNAYLSKIERTEKFDGEEVGVSDEAQKLYTDSGVVNIMLYGIDSRTMDEQSRSDAIMLLTIDRDKKKIKMTSIARDTYVYIDGYGNDKLNHAFVYGWVAGGNIADGARLSMKTINTSFHLNVTNYVTANFWALASIIDYIGGVEIDVDEAERVHINKKYIPYIRDMGIACEDIQTSGMQLLSGGQAVAYCRERYIGGDVMRGSRQREVLTAMFNKAKTLPATKYPGLVSLVLSECSTSLTNTELLDLGTWAIANMNSLQFENLGLPTEDIDTGGTYINGVWYYTYDLAKATQKIQEFILETPAATEVPVQ